MRLVTLRNLITAILATVVIGQISARQLTPEEAMQRAMRFEAQNAPAGMSRSASAPTLKLAYTANPVSAEQLPAYYVFNRGEGNNDGFIIASGDDSLRPVFAITDSGSFDAANMPPALKWLLGQYEQEIAAYLVTPRSVAPTSAATAATTIATAPALSAAPRAATTSAENYAEWTTIAPMVKTKWNQSDPYNRKCPMDTYNKKISVTGCVATAFAQIIKYHNYAQTTPGHKFQYTGVQSQVDYTMPASFDFGSMLDEYSKGEFTDAQANAVAELMAACGASVNMNYSAASSGASSEKTPYAAVKYFGYDTSSGNLSRGGMQTAEWEKAVYDELSKGRPMIYSGQATGGGHAFVCDGYLYDGLFHINWGWGGHSDGYFALSTLNPSDQGIGSFEGGYNQDQSICYFVTPDDNNKPAKLQFQVTLKDNPVVSGTSTVEMPWGLDAAPDGEAKVTAGLMMTDMRGNNPVIIGSRNTSTSVGRYFPTFSIDCSAYFKNNSVAAGQYYIYCVFKIDGMADWEKMTPAAGGNNRLILTIDEGGKRTFQEAEPELAYNVSVSAVTTNGELYIENPISLNIILTNSGIGDYAGKIVGELSKGQSSKRFEIASSALLAAGQSISFPVSVSLNGLEAGDYIVRAGKETSNGIKYFDGEYDVTINAGTAPGAELPDVPIKVTSASTMQRYYLPGDELICDIKLSASAKGSIKLTAKVIDPSTKVEVYSFYPYYFGWDVPAGNVNGGTCSFGELPKDIAPGLYSFVLYDCTNKVFTQVSEQVPISVGATIDDISYNFLLDGSGAMATAINDATAKEIVIPASVSAGGKEYPVVSIAEGLFASNKAVELIDIPASVKTIGLNAFSHTSNLKHIFFRGTTNPLPKPAIAFYLSNPDLKVYVPGEAIDEYAGFEAVGTLYATITSLSTDETDVTLKVEESKDVTLVIDPAADSDPEFTIEVSDNAIATATMKQGVITITGVKEGKAIVTVTSDQPGVAPLTINLTVGKAQVSPCEFTYTYEGQTVTYTVLDVEDRTCKTKSYISSVNLIRGDLILPAHPFDGEVEYTLIEIGQNSFDGSYLTSVVIPETVKSIGIWAFAYCQQLKSVTIPASLESIGDMAFSGCDLTSVTIPNSVTEIGKNAFYGCKMLRSVIFLTAKNPVADPASTFSGTQSNELKAYVPGESIAEYSNFEGTATVYAAITSLTVDNDEVTLNAGDELAVELMIAPAENTDPDYAIEYSAEDLVSAKVENGKLILSGKKVGKVELTVISAQPGVEPLKINVTVGEATVEPDPEDPEDPDEPVLPGDELFDIDGDTKINVTDVVLLVDKILKTTYDIEKHDLNGDKKVDVSDIVVLVNRILHGAAAKSSASRSANTAEVPVSFDMSSSCTAMQTDIIVAEGARIEDVIINASIARSHSLSYREVAPGRYRVILFSAGNMPMQLGSGEPVFTLAMNGATSVETEATVFVDTQLIPTSIDSVGAESEVESVTYFDIQGRPVSADAKGILIERTVFVGGKVVTKKIRR